MKEPLSHGEHSMSPLHYLNIYSCLSHSSICGSVNIVDRRPDRVAHTGGGREVFLWGEGGLKDSVLNQAIMFTKQ